MKQKTVHRTALATAGAAAALTAAGLLSAQASAAPLSTPTRSAAATASVKSTAPAFFHAYLVGRNEIPQPGGPAVGDPHGSARAWFEVQGDRVSYAFTWKHLAAPTEGHIHMGHKGQDGSVVIPFFMTPLPDGVSAVTGSVTVTDASLLRSIVRDPAGFYTNLHTAAFPGGAVRGQLVRSAPADLDSVLRGGPLLSLDSGRQEIPNPDGSKTGDLAASAVAQIHARGTTVTYSFALSGLRSPTEGHIHEGRVGTDGPVVVPLFADPAGLPASVTGLAGTVHGVSHRLVSHIDAHPTNYYTNLHTAAFPGGAARGQLFRVG